MAQQQQQQGGTAPMAGGANQIYGSTASSLYVGDLDPSISEGQLYEIFNQIGVVLSIRVCRDLVTQRSLGYAYINYSNPQDAIRALEILNFTPISGRPVRIMFSHRDPSIRKSGTGNIFIKNLDKSIDNKALYDTFSAFGPILSCKVAMDANGESKGHGFVQFEQETSARDAIEKVNGMLLNDKQVYVGPFIRRQERERDSSLQFSNVYVKNLAESVTEEDLKRIFGVHGPISSAVIMINEDGKSKGFGFVNFERAEDAAKAVADLNGYIHDDKEWYVGRAQKKSEREAELKAKFEQDRQARMERYQGQNLYLKNLDDSIDDKMLKDLFSEFGTITSCKVMRDPHGQSKGSGFVSFSSPEEATRAVVDMNGKMVGNKPLYVAPAQTKEERKARLQAQFSQLHSPVGIGGGVPNSLPAFHPGGPAMGPQIFYGQPPHGMMPHQPAGYGYHQQVMAGLRPSGTPMPNFYASMMHRPGQQGQRPMGRRGNPQQQQLQQQQPHTQQLLRNNNRGLRYMPNTYMPNMQNTPVSPQGMMGAMIPVPTEIGGMAVAAGDKSLQQPIPISALASALASAPVEQHRVMLGEQLYPLVDQMEHDHAGKVTGMLLEMDQTEVLHLLESPEALKAKVREAMEVLQHAQLPLSAEELESLSLNDV